MIYERIRYPDGQISAKITDTGGENVIKERINSYEDLIFIKSIAEASRHDGILFQELFVPCLFGQRSDRRFSNNQSFDLKIIADIINSCNFGNVNIFDPHSDVALALINNSHKITSLEYVQKAVSDLYRPKTGINTCNFTLVSPDAGAYKKVFEYGQRMNLPVVGAMKHRDLDGKITLSFIGDVKGKHCLIVDDICDGGATFIALGKALKEQGAFKVYLYISHGYFSRGFDDLYEVIDHIYCTNSVKDISHLDLISGRGITPQSYITQFKII